MIAGIETPYYNTFLRGSVPICQSMNINVRLVSIGLNESYWAIPFPNAPPVSPELFKNRYPLLPWVGQEANGMGGHHPGLVGPVVIPEVLALVP